MQRLIDAGETGWALASGNIRGDQETVERDLIAQRGVYTVESVSPAGASR